MLCYAGKETGPGYKCRARGPIRSRGWLCSVGERGAGTSLVDTLGSVFYSDVRRHAGRRPRLPVGCAVGLEWAVRTRDDRRRSPRNGVTWHDDEKSWGKFLSVG